jgi:hypothetical protein
LASILHDVSVGGDVVQNSAQGIFVISKNHQSTKLKVILNFSTPGLFQVLPTVLTKMVTDPFTAGASWRNPSIREITGQVIFVGGVLKELVQIHPFSSFANNFTCRTDNSHS